MPNLDKDVFAVLIIVIFLGLNAQIWIVSCQI